MKKKPEITSVEIIPARKTKDEIQCARCGNVGRMDVMAVVGSEEDELINAMIRCRSCKGILVIEDTTDENL